MELTPESDEVPRCSVRKYGWKVAALEVGDERLKRDDNCLIAWLRFLPGVNGDNLRRPRVSGDHCRFQYDLDVCLSGTNGVGKSVRELWIAEQITGSFGAVHSQPSSRKNPVPCLRVEDSRNQRKVGRRVGVVQVPASFPIALPRILSIFDPFFFADRVNLNVITQFGKQSKIPEVIESADHNDRLVTKVLKGYSRTPHDLKTLSVRCDPRRKTRGNCSVHIWSRGTCSFIYPQGGRWIPSDHGREYLCPILILRFGWQKIGNANGDGLRSFEKR